MHKEKPTLIDQFFKTENLFICEINNFQLIYPEKLTIVLLFLFL